MKNALCCRFDPTAHLLVFGPDAALFLQGQFSNDLRRGIPRACTYGLWLNQKGRAMADSFVLERAGDRFEVVSLTSAQATIRERLEAYIIADDVTVEEPSEKPAGWIFAGSHARETLEEELRLPVPDVGEFAADADGTVIFPARAASGPNWCVLSSVRDMAERISRTSARMASCAELTRERIGAGIPEISAELGPGDLPQEAGEGFEAEAISYTKGCYLGQEVMARLHNLGQVRRRLFVVRSTSAVGAGADLFLGERRVGDLRASAAGGDHAIGLAMLHTAHVQPGAQLSLAAGSPPAIDVLRVAEGKAW